MSNKPTIAKIEELMEDGKFVQILPSGEVIVKGEPNMSETDVITITAAILLPHCRKRFAENVAVPANRNIYRSPEEWAIADVRSLRLMITEQAED